MGTDQIEKVNLEELKAKVDGGGSKLLGRLKYRGRQTAEKAAEAKKKKITIEKGAKLKLEHMQSSSLYKEEELNDKFGFRCLHYSISEAAGSLQVAILKKKSGTSGSVHVRTEDEVAKSGKDY